MKNLRRLSHIVAAGTAVAIATATPAHAWTPPQDVVDYRIYAPCKGVMIHAQSLSDVDMNMWQTADAQGFVHSRIQVSASSTSSGIAMSAPDGQTFIARSISDPIGSDYDAWYDAAGNLHEVLTQKWSFKTASGATFGNMIRSWTGLNGMTVTETRSGSCSK